MAVIYVDTNASGAADGSSWTDAYNGTGGGGSAIQDGLNNWTTSDVIWIAHDSNDALTVATQFDGGGTASIPCPIYRINSSTDAYDPTTGSDVRTVETDGSNDHITFTNCVVHGIWMKPHGHLRQYQSPTTSAFYDCVIESSLNNQMLLIGQSNTDVLTRFHNCTFDCQGTNRIDVEGSGDVLFEAGTFSGTISSTGYVGFVANRYARWIFKYCDFSGITTSAKIMVDFSQAGDAANSVDFIGCKFPTAGGGSFVLTDSSTPGDTFGNQNQSVTAWHSGDAGDLFAVYRETYRGILEEDTATYQTLGWVDADQDQNYSIEMQPTQTAGRINASTPLVSFDIVTWQETTGSFGVSVQALENYTSALTDFDAWMEVFYMDTASDLLVSLATTQNKEEGLGSQSAPSALAAGIGLANWTGEPASSRSVKFLTAATINKPGLIIARIYLAKYESGKQFFYNPAMSIA